jgi:hypothetical protein
MHSNPIQFLGNVFETQRIMVKNVKGSVTVAGGVYALDIRAGDADTSGATDPVRAAQGNIVAVATLDLPGILVITPKAIADGDVGEAIISGPVKARVEGTTAVAKGDRLKANNAQNYLTKASAAAGSVDVGVAIALEAQAVAAVVVIYVIFDGICFNKVINGATT